MAPTSPKMAPRWSQTAPSDGIKPPQNMREELRFWAITGYVEPSPSHLRSLGDVRAILGPSSGHLEAILGPSWALRPLSGPSWALELILGSSWALLGPSWDLWEREAPGGVLGGSWGGPGGSQGGFNGDVKISLS